MDADTNNVGRNGAAKGSLVPAGPLGRAASGQPLTAYEAAAPYGWTEPPAERKPLSLESLRQLLTFKWSILAVGLAAAAAGALAIWTLPVFKPQFQAVGQVRVKPIIPHLVFKTEESGMIPLYQSYLYTQVAVILSPTVLGRVLDDANVQATGWYREGQRASAEREGAEAWYGDFLDSLLRDRRSQMERLREDLAVNPRGRTEVIDVAMAADSGADATVVVNAVLREYMAHVREKSDQTSDQLYQQLVKKHEGLAADIKGTDEALVTLRKDLGTGTPEELIAQRRVALNEARAGLQVLKQQIEDAQWEQRESWRLIRQDPAARAQFRARLDQAIALLAAEIGGLERGAQEPAADPPPAQGAAPQEGPGAAPPAATPELLSLMRQELAVLEGQRRELRAVVAEDAQPGDAPPDDAQPAEQDEAPDYRADPEWSRLYVEHQRLSLEVEVAQQRYAEAHPQMKELVKREEVARRNLEQREARLRDDWQRQPGLAPTAAGPAGPVSQQSEAIAAFLEARRRARHLERQQPRLEQEVAEAQRSLEWTFERARRLAALTEELRQKRELYEAVRLRLAQREMERNVPGSIEATNAIAPSKPSRDRRLLLTCMALVAALGLGVGQALLRLTWSQDVREPGDIERALPVPFLELLPHVSVRGRNTLEGNSLLAEHVRMVRTTLLQHLAEGGGRVLQITSAGPGAGKSTVAVMLARSMAHSGKKVLLVDADLRHPTLAERFAVASEPGFVASITGRAGDDQAILGTDTPGLYLLPAGRLRERADAELVTNGGFETCLDRWRRCYDIVLLDSSPILPVADGRILAQRADGTIMVVRERASRRAEVLEAFARLEACGGTLVGAVFIGSGRGGAYGYGYSSRYGQRYYGAPDGRDEA